MATRPAIYLYVAMMVVGVAACLAALASSRYTAERGTLTAIAVAIALFTVIVGAAVALAPSVSHHGDVPAELQSAYTGVIVLGQLGLWGVTAAAHDRLGVARDGATHDVDVDPIAAD